jgi:HD-like signal output (HDOD) protein
VKGSSFEIQNKIDALLERVDRLHSAPTVALRIIEILRDPEFDIDEIVKCLEHDPALASSILRLVNSSYYGLAQSVSSIQQAVVYLGPRALRLTVISFGIVKNLTRNAPGRLYSLYWRRSLTMACAARLCAKRSKADGDEAFVAGLLADLGMLLLAQAHTGEYVRLAIANQELGKLIEVEQSCYGFDHADVTARLLERWQLPEEIAQATANHHQLHRYGKPLTQLVYLANLFAEVLWTPRSPHMQALKILLSESIGCDTDALIDLALRCRQAVNESARFFRVHLAGTIDVDAVQRESRRQFETAAIDATLDLDSLEAVVGHRTVSKIG